MLPREVALWPPTAKARLVVLEDEELAAARGGLVAEKRALHRAEERVRREWSER